MSFYERFVLLCDQKGVKPSRAASECNINRSNVTSWKNNGYTPRGDVLQRIADYFGVSTDYLLGKAEQKETPQDTLERKPNRNVIKIAGRDGSFKERVLTDEQLAALAVLIDQLPDVPDDL